MTCAGTRDAGFGFNVWMLAVKHGHPALTGITGAFLAVEPEPLLAAAYALALFGLAGELAASGAIGPGTLRVRLMDALHVLDTVADREIRIREV